VLIPTERFYQQRLWLQHLQKYRCFCQYCIIIQCFWQSLSSGAYPYTYKNDLCGVRIISTPQSIMLPLKLVTCQPVRRFPTCYHAHRNPLLDPLLSQTNPIHALTSYFFQIYFSILPSMPVSSKWPLSARFSHYKPVCISLLSYACHKPKPLHPPSFGCSTHISIWPGVQIMKLLIMQFSASSYHLYPLRSKYIPQHPVLKHPCFVFFM